LPYVAFESPKDFAYTGILFPKITNLENIPAPSLQGKKGDADFCGSIPLNFLNLIQSHGLLLVVQHNSFTIVQASDNTTQILGIEAERLVKQPLEDFIGWEQFGLLRQKLQQHQASTYLPFSLQWQTPKGHKHFSATLHNKEAYLLLELEEIHPKAQATAFTTMYQEISYLVSAIKEAGSLHALAQIASWELKQLSGFDRVMIYQFDRDWNGTVIGEAQEVDLPDSFLGLRFPSTDVPRQARELYLHTPFRIISDVDAAPAKLYPVVNPLSGSLTDIAECVLRAVPLVHLEYLRNMGVKSSMSTPIVIDGQLWGLISCHHRQAKFTSFEQRATFEIVSGIIGAKISSLIMEESFRYRSQLHKSELKLTEQLYSSKRLEEGLLANPTYLLELLEAGGVALITNGRIESAGEVPPERMLQALVRWLSRYNKEKVFATDALPGLFGDAAAQRSVASGLLALQISSGRQYLLAFRPEVLKLVHWGGNPHEAIKFEPDGKQYHPRNSFNLWKEKVEFSSHPWQAEVLEAAHTLRTAILEKLVKEKEEESL
jgi:two-component system, chemotaxis family, sensor kinase Cph1